MVAMTIAVGLTAGKVAVGTGPVGTAGGRGRVPTEVGVDVAGRVGAVETSPGAGAVQDRARSTNTPAIPDSPGREGPVRSPSVSILAG